MSWGRGTTTHGIASGNGSASSRLELEADGRRGQQARQGELGERRELHCRSRAEVSEGGDKASSGRRPETRQARGGGGSLAGGHDELGSLI